MNAPPKATEVWFSTKGQVVIPAGMRRTFHIENGTRAIVLATDDGILIKPVTRHAIDRGFGLLKRRAGDKTSAEERAEHKRHEKALEDRHVHQGAR